MSVSAGRSTLTVSARSRGTATITVNASDGNGGTVDDTFTVTVKAAPVVASAIADISGLEMQATRDVSLSGVFSAAADSLAITASSSNDTKVSVASDGSKLTITGVAEGTATISVTAQDADGNRVSDSFDVIVNASAAQQQVNNAPTVAIAIADVSGLEVGASRDVSLSGVFSDADGDALTITASSSDDAKVTVSVVSDGSKLTLGGVAAGTATVTARDADGSAVRDAFEVVVVKAPEAPEPDPQEQQQEPQGDVGPEPANVRVVPGDGTLTVYWTDTPCAGARSPVSGPTRATPGREAPRTASRWRVGCTATPSPSWRTGWPQGCSCVPSLAAATPSAASTPATGCG